MTLKMLAQSGPPQTPQTPPDVVWMEIWSWLQIMLWIVQAAAIGAIIVYGSLLLADKDRGEPRGSSSVNMVALKIALGVTIASSAVQIAAWFA